MEVRTHESVSQVLHGRYLFSFVLRKAVLPYRLDYFVGVNRRRHKFSDGEKATTANRNPPFVKEQPWPAQNHSGVRCSPLEATRHSRSQQTAPPTAAFPRGYICHLRNS